MLYPDSVALAPATVWNQRGRKMTAPKKPNAARDIAITEIVNARIRNSASGTIGSGARDSIRMKITPKTSPIRISPPTDGSVQSRVGDFCVRPIRKGAIARANTPAPR